MRQRSGLSREGPVLPPAPLPIVPNPVAKGRGEIQIFSEKQKGHVFGPAVIVQITRIPALAVHISPAAQRDPESDIFACTTPDGGSKRPVLRPAFRHEGVAAGRQIDLESIPHNEVAFASLHINKGAIGRPRLPAGLEIIPCGIRTADAEREPV